METVTHVARTWWDKSWYWLVPLAFALVYEGRGIGSVGLWNDEFATAFAVQGGFGESNNEPPYLPYYTIVWLATGLGSCTTETCLRLPSAVAMIGTVVVVAITARIVGNRRAGLAAGILVAISPAAQRFAHDARPFAIATLLLSSSTLILVIAARSDRRGPWVGYGALIAATGIILPPALAVVPAHAVLLWRRPVVTAVYRRWGTSLLACIPIFLIGLYLLGSATTWRGQGDLFVVHYTNAWYAWMSINSGGIPGNPGLGELAMAVFLLGLLTRVGSQWLAAAAIAAAVVWLASFGPYSWFMGRFFMPFIGIAAVAAALGLAQLSAKRMSVALAVIVVVAFPAYTANRFPWSRGYDFRTALDTIAAEWQPGDSIVTGGDGSAGGALRYYLDSDPRYDAPAQPDGRYWVLVDAADCTPTKEWDLGLGNTLKLCTSVEGGS